MTSLWVRIKDCGKTAVKYWSDACLVVLGMYCSCCHACQAPACNGRRPPYNQSSAYVCDFVAVHVGGAYMHVCSSVEIAMSSEGGRG